MRKQRRPPCIYIADEMWLTNKKEAEWVYMKPIDCLLDRNPHDNPHFIRIPIFRWQESTWQRHSESYVCQVYSQFCVDLSINFQASAWQSVSRGFLIQTTAVVKVLAIGIRLTNTPSNFYISSISYRNPDDSKCCYQIPWPGVRLTKQNVAGMAL